MKSSKNEYITESVEETQRVAKEFAQKLIGGNVIALYGDLGSGKTTFVQGLAKGLGIKKRIISPTFIIVRRYRTGIRNFYHIDLYRVETQQDVERLGIEETLSDPQAIVAIEWAGKMGELLPKKRIDIHFKFIDENIRRVYVDRYV